MSEYRYHENAESSLFDTQHSEQFIKNEILAEQLNGMIQNRRLRLYFSLAVFLGVACYIYFVIDIVYKSGEVLNMFILSDTVLVTLLSTTTANIVGILALVVKYLFPKKRKEESEGE